METPNLPAAPNSRQNQVQNLTNQLLMTTYNKTKARNH